MQLAKKTGIPSDWTKYKQHKRITQEQVRQAHWSYVNAILSKSLEHGNNKPLWKYIKARRCDNIGVAEIKNDCILYHDSKAKAELLFHQFSKFLLWMMTQIISLLCHIPNTPILIT